MEKQTTKLFTGYKDYNIKELYLKDNDQYKSLINNIEEFYKENFPNTNKNTYLGSEDLQKDTKFSIGRFFFENNKLTGFCVVYSREKKIKINDKDQLCYILRGFAFKSKDGRGKNDLASFGLKYSGLFLKVHYDKPTFIFSKSTSPITVYIFTKYFNGYIGLPTTLIELNENPQLKNFLAELSNKAAYDLHKLCDRITEIIEPNPEQIDIYKKSGRVHLDSTISEKIEYKPDNNSKKELLFRLFENQEYPNTEGYAIPTLISINKKNLFINYIILSLANGLKKIVGFFSNWFSFGRNSFDLNKNK